MHAPSIGRTNFKMATNYTMKFVSPKRIVWLAALLKSQLSIRAIGYARCMKQVLKIGGRNIIGCGLLFLKPF
jgi:hypothetical protein